ncbi:hypothetical protein MKW94_022158 [Papaver nudicaule]|uniref:Uncharacterized protein n=1 Tax=Papaver nudicaule TaxID=74823 RepID=A0AA41V8P7_PAPNU|nr:hypothetical protein [Papaver nudicaule]
MEFWLSRYGVGAGGKEQLSLGFDSGFVGPIGHCCNIALGRGVFGPIYGISFFRDIGDLISSMAMELHLDQFINFRHLWLMYQLLYVNMFYLLNSAFVSWIEQQEDAPWKKHCTSFLTLEDELLGKKPIKEEC